MSRRPGARRPGKKKKKSELPADKKKNVRETTRDLHLTILSYLVRMADLQAEESLEECEGDSGLETRSIDERFPIYLRHVLVKYSNTLKGEPEMTVAPFFSGIREFLMRNYDGIKDDDSFRDVYKKEVPQYRVGMNRYVRMAVECTDSSSLTFQIPLMNLIINDCNSTMLTVKDVMSGVELINSANLTLIYSDNRRDTDTTMITCDMCFDIRIILPLDHHSSKPFRLRVARTDKVTVVFQPLRLQFRVNLADELEFDKVSHIPLELDPITQTVRLNGNLFEKIVVIEVICL